MSQRPLGERRRVIAAVTLLLVIMAGHAMRETARDALFLSDLSPRRLPWAYLAIALLALVIGYLGRPWLTRFSHRSLLTGSLALGAALDVGFWATSRGTHAAPLFALYVWTGLLSTVVTMLFWLHLADVCDIGQAKRSFAAIAAGGLAGAIAGSGSASLLLLRAPTRALLLGSSTLFGIAAVLAALEPRITLAPPPPREAEPLPRALGVRSLLESGYLRRLMALAASTALLGTGVDFVFKSGVAAAIPRAQLGRFFAHFNVIVGGAALLFQVFLAPVLLQTLGVIRALAVLPALLLIASGAVAASPALLPLLLLRGVDGTLRHSLHRSGTEILYVPVDGPKRSTYKMLVESIGQRGGQALASLGILLAIAFRASHELLAALLLGVSLVTLLALIGLRREYVARFREQLRALSPDLRSSVPRLDLHSLEVLLSSVSSPNDAEVLSALDLLDAYGKTSLISPLILHHPSRAVVLRALELLADSEHPHRDVLVERLLRHDDPDVRAAALRAYAARSPSGAQIARLLREDPSLAVRATALTAWIGRRANPVEIRGLIEELLERSDRNVRLALARVLPKLPYEAMAESSHRLIRDPDGEVPAELAAAASSDPRPEQIPLLVALLQRRQARPAARAALVALGDASLGPLADALRRDDTPEALRCHLPRTLSRFSSPRAVELLVEALEEGCPRVRYKALRGLGRMRADDPALPVPAEALLRVAEQSLQSAVTMLCCAVAHEAWLRLRGEAVPAAVALLRELLDEKQQGALERVFRALHILEPRHEYAVIFEALREGGSHGAGSREVLEHLVEGPLRNGLLAMVDSRPPLERLRGAVAFFEPPGAGRLLELVTADGEQTITDADRQKELDDLALSFFAAAERDRDPILGSVARQALREASPRSESGDPHAG